MPIRDGMRKESMEKAEPARPGAAGPGGAPDSSNPGLRARAQIQARRRAQEEERAAAKETLRDESRTGEEIISTLEDIPPMGSVAVRVMKMVEEDRTSAADLARVISRDQGLAAKILRTCNTSYFGLGRSVTSLSQAVVVLGLRMVRNLVLFHSLPVGKNGGGRMSAAETRIWTNSVGSALGSRLVAQNCGRVDPEFAFLAGLFHDVGRLLFNLVRPMTYDALCRQMERGLPSRETERTHLGLDHTVVGSKALDHWKMGTELAQCARDHHLDPAVLDPVTLVVRGAEELMAGIGEGETDMEPGRPDAGGADGPEPGGTLALLGLEDVREEMEERLRATLEQEQAFFRQAA